MIIFKFAVCVFYILLNMANHLHQVYVKVTNFNNYVTPFEKYLLNTARVQTTTNLAKMIVVGETPLIKLISKDDWAKQTKMECCIYRSI